jgi:hypothetical protein
MADLSEKLDSKKFFEQRLEEMRTERSEFETIARDIKNYVKPYKGRFLPDQRNERAKWNKIIDNTGTMASRTATSGMMTGMTNPARKWFRLRVPKFERSDQDGRDLTDQEAEFQRQLRSWLMEVENIIFRQMGKSNIYNALSSVYNELVNFGTGPVAIVEDPKQVFRAIPFTFGEYFIQQNDRLEVDTFYREFEMTVKQIMEKFPEENVSRATKRLYQNGHLTSKVKVVHAIEPNPEGKSSASNPKDKPYRSVYFERGQETEDKFLEVGGHTKFPVAVPRWEVTAGDTYGTNCPAMTALGDIKQLQQEQRRKAQGIDKMVDPPMQGPSSMENRKVSTLPGKMTYFDMTAGQQQGATPLFQVNVRLNELLVDIQDVQRRISRAFFEDLFLLLTQDRTAEQTATEASIKDQEKLMQLGPVLHRLEHELLDRIVMLIFDIMKNNGHLPEMPEGVDNLSEDDLQVEYLSILSQAQQANEINKAERFTVTLGNMAGLDPTVLDKWDADNMVNNIAKALGIDVESIKSDEEVQQIRQRRQQQEQAAQAQQSAETAKTATEAGRNLAESTQAAPEFADLLTGGNV